MPVIERALDVVQREASLPSRMALGASMVYHGTQKLRGEGRAQTARMMEGLGMKRGRFWGLATGIAETFAGVASILGIAARPAALAVLVTQGVAIAKVHWPKGYASMKGGMEYNLALVAIALGMLTAGPGKLSVHRLLERRYERRVGWKLLRRGEPNPWARALLVAL